MTTESRLQALKENGFDNLFVEVTKEEVIASDKRLYNSSAWKERVLSLDKYPNTKFYQQGDKFFGIYTTDDGVKRMLEIQYSLMLCSGLLRQYSIMTFDNIIHLRLVTPKGMGIDQSVKGVKKQMALISKTRGDLFTKAI